MCAIALVSSLRSNNGGEANRLFTKGAFRQKSTVLSAAAARDLGHVGASAQGAKCKECAAALCRGAKDGHERTKDVLTAAELAALPEAPWAGRHVTRGHLLLLMMLHYGLCLCEWCFLMSLFFRFTFSSAFCLAKCRRLSDQARERSAFRPDLQPRCLLHRSSSFKVIHSSGLPALVKELDSLFCYRVRA